jgi:hypothetical protein
MVDRYTKAVLTVIAGALSIIAIQGLIGATHAQLFDRPQEVQICDSLHQCAGLSPIFSTYQGRTTTTYGLTVVPAK